MRTSPQAAPFSPAELVRLRAMLRQVERAPVIDDYLESSEVARRLGLTNRTVRDLAASGAFDVDAHHRAFKPAANRLRIPTRGVQGFIERNAVQTSAPARSFFSEQQNG